MKAPRSAPLLLLLLQCVSSLPVTHTHLEHEDVKVIKCIVEVLAEALSTPASSLPVSQQCLETLRSDDRLVTVLRRRNFLQELQDIATEGANERSEKETKALQEPADRSMLMAVRTPGVMLEERRAEHGSQENDIITSPEKAEKEEEDSAVMKKTENSEEEEDDEAEIAPEHNHVEESQSQGEGHQKERHQEAVEKRQSGVERHRDWSRSKETVLRRAYSQREAPQHSKEMFRSPEEEELQIMAGRESEEGRDLEEGSANKKTEDAEMESLAVMENELENMAQKLHKLQHG